MTEKALEVFEEKLIPDLWPGMSPFGFTQGICFIFLFGQTVIAKYQYLDSWVRKELWVSGKELLADPSCCCSETGHCLSSEEVFNRRKGSTALQKHLAGHIVLQEHCLI